MASTGKAQRNFGKQDAAATESIEDAPSSSILGQVEMLFIHFVPHGGPLSLKFGSIEVARPWSSFASRGVPPKSKLAGLWHYTIDTEKLKKRKNTTSEMNVTEEMRGSSEDDGGNGKKARLA
jgi:hypothetical protein